MKIAVFHNLPTGGALRMLRDKIKLFRQMSHTVSLYDFSTADRRLFSPVDSANDVTVEPLDFKGAGRFLRYWHASRRLAAKIDASDADRVWVEKCRFAGSPWILQHLKKPSIYYMQEPLRIRAYEALAGAPGSGVSLQAPPPLSAAEVLRKAFKAPAHYLIKSQDRKSFSSASKVFTNSRFSAEWSRRIYGTEPRVLYQGVDTDFFTPELSESEHFVLSVGRIDDVKGHFFLIDVLSGVTASIRPALYIVADSVDAVMEERLRLAAQRKNVPLLIHVRIPDETLKGLYRRCRLVLCAARNEPFGLVPLEAMACAAPVIAAREGGFLETVADGKTGRLLERNASAWTREIEVLLRDDRLREQYGKAGRAEAESRWGMDIFRQRLEESLV